MSLMLSAAEYVSLKAPFGLDQICGTFGDIFTYLRPDQTLDPRWQAEQMITISLPFPLVLSWDHSRRVSHMTCHRLMQAIILFALIAAGIVAYGLLLAAFRVANLRDLVNSIRPRDLSQ